MDIRKDEDGQIVVTLAQAFVIMEAFVTQFGDRDGWSDGGLVRLGSFISTAVHARNVLNPLAPDDPAMWADWKDSARLVYPELWDDKA